jgi:hypothetical protein
MLVKGNCCLPRFLFVNAKCRVAAKRTRALIVLRPSLLAYVESIASFTIGTEVCNMYEEKKIAL